MASARRTLSWPATSFVQAPERILAGRQRLKLGCQIMVIGDDDGQAPILGEANGRSFVDAGVAGQQQVDRDVERLPAPRSISLAGCHGPRLNRLGT